LPRRVFAPLAGIARRGGGWASEHAGLLLGAFGMALIVPLTIVVMWWSSHWLIVRNQKRITLDMALAALDAEQWAQAKHLAQRVVSDPENPDPPGGRALIMGAVAAAEAEGLIAEDAAKLNLVAVRWLQEARALGLPEDRQTQSLWLLGRAQFLAKHYSAAKPLLLEAAKRQPNLEEFAYPLLVTACRLDEHRNLKAALDYTAKWLAIPELPPEVQLQALIQRTELLLAEGDLAGAKASIERIAGLKDEDGQPLDAGSDLPRLRAQTIMLAAQQTREASPEPEAKLAADKQLDEAIGLLREAQARDIIESERTFEAMFLVGQCYEAKGDLAAAQAQYQRVESLDSKGASGLVARVSAADVARRRGEDAEAITLYKQVLATCGPPQDFANPWLTVDELRRRVLQAWQYYYDQQQFDQAIELGADLFPLVTKAESLSRKGESYESWARAIEANPQGASKPSNPAAAERWREAGDTFRELARLRFSTRFYTDDLWRSADCYVRGEAPKQATEALREYLRFEPLRRRAQALVGLGTAMHALGDDAAALAAAQQCIDFHADQASVYQARILASQVYLERKDLTLASAALEANLRDDALMPTSREWRDSLFLLGKLLFDEAQAKSAPTLGAADVQRAETLATLEAADDLYRTSLARLREAVARYPHIAESLEARYLVADGHRLLARLPRERLNIVTVQTTRLSLVKHMRDDLQAAVDGFADLQEELVRLQEETPLTAPQEMLLRNAYFGRAAALFELEQFEEASEAYADAASRYQQYPEALDALVQLAACYQRLARPAEARGALEQARIVWQQLPTEVAWQSTTPFDRDEWQRRLDWLERN